ncbi:MAG: hypothetical protein AAF772_10360 [Acidobacteriota bacterium]
MSKPTTTQAPTAMPGQTPDIGANLRSNSAGATRTNDGKSFADLLNNSLGSGSSSSGAGGAAGTSQTATHDAVRADYGDDSSGYDGGDDGHRPDAAAGKDDRKAKTKDKERDHADEVQGIGGEMRQQIGGPQAPEQVQRAQPNQYAAEMARLADQMIKQVETVQRAGRTEMNVQLNSGPLGVTGAKVVRDGSGRLDIRVMTADQLSQQIVQRNMQTLNDALLRRGLHVQTLGTATAAGQERLFDGRTGDVNTAQNARDGRGGDGDSQQGRGDDGRGGQQQNRRHGQDIEMDLESWLSLRRGRS